VEQGVYRIAQETLENVVRHAAPSTIGVELREGSDGLALRIEDDGEGMDARVLEEAGDGRLGIRGMQERAAWIGGKLEITSAAGSGTSIALTVPLERTSDDPCPDL
jgi:signal transduction histidine kinase